MSFEFKRLCPKSIRLLDTVSRKGAKRCRVSNGFLCVLAPLREKISFSLPRAAA
jgi:hypothetical protein